MGRERERERERRHAHVLVVTLPLLAACAATDGGDHLATSPTVTASQPAAPPPAAVAAPGPAAPEPDVAREADAPSLTITTAGDVVLSARLVGSALARRDEGGFARVLEGYRTLLDPRAVNVLNVESPLVDDVVAPSAGWPPVLGAPPEVAAALSAIGVDAVSVANNHAYDQGHEGLDRTIDLLRAAGIEAVGAGTDLDGAYAARVLRSDGWAVAVLACTGPMNHSAAARGHRRMHVARLWSEERVLAALVRARASADVVVLALHWGREFDATISVDQRRLARRLIDAGADLVVGTGPHVLQPVEHLESPRGDAVVAYSLGNLVSSMAFGYRPGTRPRGFVHPANAIPASRDGLLLRVSLERASTGRLRVSTLSGVPLWTLIEGPERRDAPLDIRVVPLADAPADVRAERFPLVREAVGPRVELVDR